VIARVTFELQASLNLKEGNFPDACKPGENEQAVYMPYMGVAHEGSVTYWDNQGTFTQNVSASSV
jgi:hypothetical protein